MNLCHFATLKIGSVRRLPFKFIVSVDLQSFLVAESLRVASIRLLCCGHECATVLDVYEPSTERFAVSSPMGFKLAVPRHDVA